MDLTQLTFLVGTIVPALVKYFFLKESTRSRDRLLPVFAFLANLLTRIVQEATGAGNLVGGTAALGGGIALASIWASLWTYVQLPATTLLDTFLSLGLHRAKRWRDAMMAK